MLKRERPAQQGHTPERDGSPRLPGWNFGRRAGVIGIGMLASIIVTGCSMQEAQRGWMPEPATTQGSQETLPFWQGAWVAALAVGVLVWGLMIFAIIAYRRAKNPDNVPVQTRYNMPIEALWTIAPLIMVVGVFFYAATRESELTSLKSPTQQTVDVVGFRWSWIFNYVNEDVFDTGEPVYTGSFDTRVDDAAGVPADTPLMPTLYLPVNKSVQFNLNSPDVTHSFWVANFLFKLDTVPGRTNSFQVTPTVEGTYAGRCAELCGVDHSRMLFTVKVVSQQEFDAHVQALRLRGQTGQLETGRTSDKAQDV